MKLGEFITSQAALVGINADDQHLKDFLAKSDVSNYELPTELASKIGDGLFTLESAKNNTTVKNHFVAQAYSGIDAGHTAFIDKAGFDAGVKSKLLDEKSTGKRETMLFDEISKLHNTQLEAAKADGGDGGDGAEALTAANQKITDLNGQITGLGDTHNQALTDLKATHANEITGFAVGSVLATMPYAQKELPIDANVNTARYFVDKAITEKGLTVINKGGAISLQTSDGLEYFEQSKKVSFNDFTKNILTENKLLDVAGAGAPAPAPAPGAGGGAPAPSAAATPGIDKMAAAAEAAEANLANAPDHSKS